MEPYQHHHHHHQLKQHLTTSTPLDPQPLSHLPPSSSLFIPQLKHLINTHQQQDNKNNILQHFPPTPSSQSFNLSNTPPPASPVRYKECLKNHAAAMGTNVVDGCGEFMPSGNEGTFGALKCAACNCHRNFHRRDHDHSASGFSGSVILHLPPPPSQHPFHPQPMTVAYGGGGANTESSSDDLVQVQRELLVEAADGSNRKRFRTKFTQEQKDKMLGFAEKLEWRLQRQDDEMVERFCNEVGIRRQVLKVWMHNNKNSFKKLLPDVPNEQQLLPQQHLLHSHSQQLQIKQQQEETLL